MSKGGGGVNIPSNYTIGGNGAPILVDSDADVTVNSNLAVTTPIVTQATSKNDSTANLNLKVEPLTLKLEPVKVDLDTNSVIELKPVKADVDTSSVIDLKPVAVDTCQTIKLAPLPPIHIDQPYSHHFGFTIMGMELWGFTISGKSETHLHSPGKQQHYSKSMPGHQAPNKDSAEEQSSVRPRSGLRVRVSD
jgi:hypothetical protein